MANDFLDKIIEAKSKHNQEKKAYYEQLKGQLSQTTYSHYALFKKQIAQSGKINIIAEIKKASPSQGLIREDFDLLTIAKVYADHHVSAISVLTEEKYFLGKPEYVKKVSTNVGIPVLAKDFFIDEGQIYEARFNGASAILLIMAILNDDQASLLHQTATTLDLDCLAEVHNKEELDRALALDMEIIGINNRDLRTLEVDLKTSLDLIPHIPQEKIIVAESGIRTAQDIAAVKAAGAQAVLIGETFMREKDIGAKIMELTG